MTASEWHAWDVRPRNPHLKTANFNSGVNQQKIVIAREDRADPDILLIGQPTRRCRYWGDWKYTEQKLWTKGLRQSYFVGFCWLDDNYGLEWSHLVDVWWCDCGRTLMHKRRWRTNIWSNDGECSQPKEEVSEWSQGEKFLLRVQHGPLILSLILHSPFLVSP